MKELAIVLVVVALFATLSGCSGNTIPKPFFGTEETGITFYSGIKAQKLMIKKESLLATIRGEEPPLADEVLLPIYRDTDRNRDHQISLKEAVEHDRVFVIQIEDSFGKVKFQPD